MDEKKKQFIRFLHIDAFGSFANKTFGPFSPGMNVVYGKNEAGKSSFAAFIDGVLFGWREARGKANTYKPENAERSGSIYFAQKDNEEAPMLQVSRVRNTDGLQGDSRVTDDIDEDTYRSVFSLTSDTLLSLRNTSDITAKLLTAGSGTDASPAFSLAEIQRRLASYVSTAAANTHSLVQLNAKREALHAELLQAADNSDALRNQSRELASLEEEQHDINERLNFINRSIDNVTTCIASTDAIDNELRSLDAEVKRIQQDKEATAADQAACVEAIGAHLAHLTVSEERSYRDKLNRLKERQERLERSMDIARENHRASKAYYEVLTEHDSRNEQESAQRKRNHRVQMTLATGVPIVMLLCGVLLFVLGQRSSSFSTMVLGFVLILSSLFLSAGSVILLLRPQKKGTTQEEQKQDARWVMLQDQKKLEGCQEEINAFNAEVCERLAEMGLAHADGSIHNALSILDEVKETRARIAIFQQHLQADDARLTEATRRQTSLKEQRLQSYERAGINTDATFAQLEAELDSRTLQRDELMEVLQSIHDRHGQLKQILKVAQEDKQFSLLKIQYEEILTQIKESTTEYMALLLAERMLQGAIDSWEALTQPEVYKRAGAMLSLMTEGRWTGVVLNPDGELCISDGGLTTRSVQQLSLGTCQQLYLSLRIALLLTADNVGRAIPIVADDILVNFDAQRRLGAARALLQLSEMRQVILLTCHEEVVNALSQVAHEEDISLNLTNI